MFLEILLIISILAGQLIKFPLFGNLGPTLLDFFVILFCLLGLFKLKFKLKKPPSPIKYALLFAGIALLSLIFTPLNLQPMEYLFSFSYIVRFIFIVCASWIIYSDGFDEFRQKLPQTLLLSGVGLAILGLLQFLVFPNMQFMQQFGWDPHYFRTVSTFLDPNFAGAYFVLTILLISYLGGQHMMRRRDIFICTIVFIALLTTFSRSSYLMFLISGVILSFLRKSKSLALGTFILFLFLLAGFQLYTQLVAKPRNIDREESASYRFTTWQQGLNVFQHSPILGIGFNSYKYAIREYQLSDEQFLESRGSSSNDSSLLFVLATTGILGFIIYILFLGSLIKVGSPVLTAGLMGLLIHSFFANSLFYSPILLWVLFISTARKK